MATTPRYVAEMIAAKDDADRCCFISDGGQAGATVLYRDRWLVIQHFARDLIRTAEQIALVTLDELADPDVLTQLSLAVDFEDRPLWLIDARKLVQNGDPEESLEQYGAALKVLWQSGRAE